MLIYSITADIFVAFHSMIGTMHLMKNPNSACNSLALYIACVISTAEKRH